MDTMINKVKPLLSKHYTDDDRVLAGTSAEWAWDFHLALFRHGVSKEISELRSEVWGSPFLVQHEARDMLFYVEVIAEQKQGRIKVHKKDAYLKYF